MKTFTIDSNNNITAFSSLDEARAAGLDNAEYFGSSAELAKLVSAWPGARPAEVWNSFAGVAPFADLKPVKKFTDRKVAVARIWKAVQALSPIVAQPAATAASAAGKAKKSPTDKNQRATPRIAANTASDGGREGSKKTEVQQLIRRPDGATLAEIMELTGWQAHTVRGFISGTLGTKLGLTVESFRNEQKERTYRIK